MGSAPSVRFPNHSLSSIFSISIDGNPSPEFTSIDIEHNNYEKEAHSSDTSDTLVESDYPTQFFELINLDLKTKADILREQTFERKIYLSFVKQLLWKHRIAPEFRRILLDASHKHFNTSNSWQANTISSTAKQIYNDEIVMDNSIHSSLESSNYYSLLQLQSILIVCTLKSYFQMRSYLDFTIDNSSNNKDHLIEQLKIVSSCTQDEDDNNDNCRDSHTRDDDYEDENDEIEYSNDPELLLLSIAQDSSEFDLEELLISGNWMHTIMQMFECLPFQMNIFHVSSMSSNRSLKQPMIEHDVSLLYSNKNSFTHEHSVYSDIFDTNNPSELSQQVRDCFQSTITSKKIFQKTFWEKKNPQSKPLFTTFLPLKCKRSSHDFPPSFFSSTSTRPVDEIIEFDSIVTLHVDTQTLYTSRSLYQSLDLLLFSIAMLV